MSLDPVWEPWAGLTLREVEFAHHGFRQPICYGVEITEYPVVSGRSAGSAEGIGLELLDGQTVAEVAAFRLWGSWGRCGLVRLARDGGGRE